MMELLQFKNGTHYAILVSSLLCLEQQNISAAQSEELGPSIPFRAARQEATTNNKSFVCSAHKLAMFGESVDYEIHITPKAVQLVNAKSGTTLLTDDWFYFWGDVSTSPTLGSKLDYSALRTEYQHLFPRSEFEYADYRYFRLIDDKCYATTQSFVPKIPETVVFKDVTEDMLSELHTTYNSLNTTLKDLPYQLFFPAFLPHGFVASQRSIVDKPSSDPDQVEREVHFIFVGPVMPGAQVPYSLRIVESKRGDVDGPTPTCGLLPDETDHCRPVLTTAGGRTFFTSDKTPNKYFAVFGTTELQFILSGFRFSEQSLIRFFSSLEPMPADEATKLSRCLVQC